MPPLAGLPDEQLAGILTYIRQSWGHQASPITPAMLRAQRPRPAAAK
jgi:mono/diheme cytochrome c family protein